MASSKLSRSLLGSPRSAREMWFSDPVSDSVPVAFHTAEEPAYASMHVLRFERYDHRSPARSPADPLMRNQRLRTDKAPCKRCVSAGVERAHLLTFHLPYPMAAP